MSLEVNIFDNVYDVLSVFYFTDDI